MRSLKLYGKQDLRFEEAEKPVLEKETDVIIKVKAVGICGSDLSRYKKLGPYVSGMVWGHEFSGEVVETGSQVRHVAVGDRVAGAPCFTCADLDVEEECYFCKKSEFARCENLTVIGARHGGAYAEYIRLPEKNCVPIPDSVDYESAAMIEPSAVVVHGFYHTNLTAGDTVVVVGCGNIGLLSIKFAKIFGATKIIAVDIADEALEMAKAAGASHTINSLKVDTLETIASYTDGLMSDIVVESAGSPITSAQVFAYAKKGGGVVFMGIPYADISIERFYFEKIVRSELKVWGAWSCVSAPFPGKEWHTIMALLENGQLELKSMITHRLTLAEGPEIFDTITHKKPEDNFGKVMFFPEKE
ncbi:galactitol-1-phosphate 5-dehydrogenase [Enterococcus sp. 669A]|uniref:Galactitol-1-phosphate 5-dehydrogenase n=1 Tax=Candidatus Enterococcus moelleringii TaxID=2815325 RepID=A0ABS3LGB5_9ENTE|nr:galactitol-1-phosphate 5-dehydrogenase [Enterococcus sp. 669A]MBO1308692.1 galactitol-1-phosphate 5-dehydrogenase [Enterococcus sp. 669A]